MPRVTPITSRDNPLLMRLRKLAAQPDGYRKQGRVWLEGEHLCRAWLAHAPGSGVQALVGESAWAVPALRELASQADAVALLPDTLMRGIGTLDASAPLAFEVAWPGAGTVRPGSPSIVLDRVQDAGNVGTILRSAAALGCTQVVALKGTAALWSPKVVRAGMGAHFALNLIDAADPAVLDELDVPLLATSSHAELELHRAPLPWPCAWLLGHEGQGVAETLMRRCAQTVRIVQPGGEESLNVAVAASICMYESARRRLAD